MTNNKKYYWLKLKDDFFTQKAIKKLRKIAGGDTFTIIYLKMMLLAMKNEGKIFHDGIENEFYKELALDLDEDEENVQLTIGYLMKHKLLEVIENEYYLHESVTSTGTESESAERVRRHRENLLINGTKKLQCNNDVTISNDLVTKCNTEIEIEKEIEKDKEKKEKKIKYSESVYLYQDEFDKYIDLEYFTDVLKGRYNQLV
jgi:predicted phage replisome organizer